MTLVEKFKEGVSHWLFCDIDDYDVIFIYDDGKKDGVSGILVYINGKFICFLPESHLSIAEHIIGNVIRRFANKKGDKNND